MTAYRVTSHDVDVAVEDGPVALGLTTGLRERTVHAKALTLRFRPDGVCRRIEITGPYERSNGEVTAVYTTVLVDTEDEGGLRYRPAPQWVLDIVEAVRP